VESKREEFRRYLEGAGVLDAFTKGSKQHCNIQPCYLFQWLVLVGLYEEPDKPKEPMEYP
jgi:hypothetical protein